MINHDWVKGPPFEYQCVGCQFRTLHPQRHQDECPGPATTEFDRCKRREISELNIQWEKSWDTKTAFMGIDRGPHRLKGIRIPDNKTLEERIKALVERIRAAQRIPSTLNEYNRQLIQQHQDTAQYFYGQMRIPPVSPPDDPPPVTSAPEELTPIPRRKIRKCYVCGDSPAVARAYDEPAYCEEHRRK